MPDSTSEIEKIVGKQGKSESSLFSDERAGA
jgi:hypothetical protein